MPNVLIADDEPLVRQLVRETLSIDPTLSFLEAANGLVALESARAARPDLIILDIMMPKMDGLQVCRLLKADPALCTVPVILVTAYAMSRNEAAGRDAGADAFVPKPFEEKELLDAVSRALHKHTE
jgi:CheY-like chemotaxis protein